MWWGWAWLGRKEFGWGRVGKLQDRGEVRKLPLGANSSFINPTKRSGALLKRPQDSVRPSKREENPSCVMQL